jgi:hypothetical protein
VDFGLGGLGGVAGGVSSRLGLAEDANSGFHTAIVCHEKFSYIFGDIDSGAHNAERAIQNLDQMQRLGIFNNDTGRGILQEHFDTVVQDPTNIARTYTTEYGTFQVRESLLAGPSGAFAALQTTWQVQERSFRFVTIIPHGG